MILAAIVLLATVARGDVLVTMDEALLLAFPGCEVAQRTEYLTHEQRAAAAEQAKVRVESALVRAYEGRCEGVLAGTAYFDTHPVRDLPSTMMVVVGPDGSVARVELLSFEGAAEHRPGPGFYERIRGMRLDRDLALRRSALRPVSGATLSSRAAVEATRRVLALHEVIQQGHEP